jgi:hypothetical protein
VLLSSRTIVDSSLYSLIYNVSTSSQKFALVPEISVRNHAFRRSTVEFATGFYNPETRPKTTNSITERYKANPIFVFLRDGLTQPNHGLGKIVRQKAQIKILISYGQKTLLKVIRRNKSTRGCAKWYHQILELTVGVSSFLPNFFITVINVPNLEKFAVRRYHFENSIGNKFRARSQRTATQAIQRSQSSYCRARRGASVPSAPYYDVITNQRRRVK